jgi:23S rRNA (guanosine2251-2'-O)-methyltransferase
MARAEHSERPERAERPERRGRDHRGERPYEESPKVVARRGRGTTGEADSPRPQRDAAMAAPSGSLWLYGMHAVSAALANPRRRARRLLATADAEEALAERLLRPWRLPAERVEKNRFQTFLPEDAVHQGIALLADPLPPSDLEDAIAASSGPVLLLDQVTDPRNVGAVLRSAAAFGAAAVVMQDRNAPPETAALARTASGALEVVPVVREVNLARTIQTLQKAGFWVMGLAGEATRTLAEACPRDRRVALVLGAEDTGLRRLQRETCDELVRLPIQPVMESLNVSAAATAALYELARNGQADET